MITIKFKERDNYRTMARVTSRIENGVFQGASETADMVIADIQSGWSTSRQSIGSGNPPAMDTGNLDSSIRKEDQGRDALGHFDKKGDDAKAYYIHIDTEEGNNPNGRGNYAMALEDPDYYDLPFISPALERAFGVYTSNIKRFIR